VWEGRSREAPPYPDQWRKAAAHINDGFGMSAPGEELMKRFVVQADRGQLR